MVLVGGRDLPVVEVASFELLKAADVWAVGVGEAVLGVFEG